MEKRKMSDLKIVHNKEQIQYLAEQLNFAKKNKLDVDRIYLWFEEEDSSFPDNLEVAFTSNFGKKD
jgi:hypothetical protein